MGKVLATIPSSSNPAKMYNITMANDGKTVYCGCWGWKRNRTCSHLDQYKYKAIQAGLKPTPVWKPGQGISSPVVDPMAVAIAEALSMLK